ncbi:3-oxoacyl-ACP synthase [Reichenbachiella ulvae]|uniref:3-oxoacyl-ACP synthase n=1 Tax=Reichenbachiella ulvae TaxID=2980104 RepID=A0ABT3CWN0_9BACT|nr:3-oxoacyl-ACP synthase [Reichenbachiella ulvae]MCV9388037.1 3-oxoacyl-ACP synthase [Reichenbachiella ulvae]
MKKKELLFRACMDVLEQKIAIAKDGMQAAQDSANNETKSSAGDKYETGRAMSQNERDMYAKQLAELQHQYKMLKSIDPKKKLDRIETGAWVTTESAEFFISIGLGLVKWELQSIMAISPVSPIAQQLLGKGEGDSYSWMNKDFKILKVQ